MLIERIKDEIVDAPDAEKKSNSNGSVSTLFGDPCLSKKCLIAHTNNYSKDHSPSVDVVFLV